MLIEVHEPRLLVISDLHLGNPFSLAGQRLRGFLDHAREEGFSLCINGDGLEILQASFAALARHSLEVLQQVHRVREGGGRVYYVVGNHDIVLEHLLNTWLRDHLAPFLNVRSGDQRIRVEHGHLYDPFFVRSAWLYQVIVTAAAPMLHLYPDFYYLWSWSQRARRQLRGRLFKERPGHGCTYYEAAELLLARGFDAVVFGHTHHPEVATMERGGLYVNAGNWMRNTNYVEIVEGHVALKRWDRGRGLPWEGVPKLLAASEDSEG